jgi:regulator of nucleoside diphosphate kinase
MRHAFATVPAPSLVISAADRDRLLPVIDQHDSPAAEALEAELLRATIVPPEEVPADVVTLHGDVVYEDLSTGQRRTVRVVLPREADPRRGWISVLAPVGSTLLGLRVGQEIDWPLPGGARRIRVVELPRAA